MDTESALKILREYYSESSKEHGVLSIGLFGSIARGKGKHNSDIDVVVTLEKPSLFELAAIQQDLSEKFHQKVDLVRYRDSMNNFLKERIERDAIYV